jgi:mannosyl-oligosaccharide glucosidase
LQAAIEAEHAVDAFEFSPLSSLFCSVPSRSFFPRGFSWDDGFHQLVIQQFAPLKSYEVLISPFNSFSSPQNF